MTEGFFKSQPAAFDGKYVNQCLHAHQTACIEICPSPEQRDSAEGLYLEVLYLNNPELLGSFMHMHMFTNATSTAKITSPERQYLHNTEVFEDDNDHIHTLP